MEKKSKCLYCEAQCPTCGYYCLGKGGIGCIHKETHNCEKFTPSQPNSEESQYVKGAGGCCEKCEIYLDYKDSYQCNDGDCDCHYPKPDENRCDKCNNPNCKKTCDFYTYPNDSKLWQKTIEISPKPDENTYEKISKETERSARLASDKMSGYPLPDTTEEKKKHSMLCKSRNVDGKFYAGSYEGMKEPENCDCHNNTSDEWWEIEFKQKFSNYNLASEAYANGKNYKAIDFVIDFIKSLLSQSEQRVRKEMVEAVEKYQKEHNFWDEQSKDQFNKGALHERNKMASFIINLISK